MTTVQVYPHTSRGYYDVYNALVNAYPNKPVWLWNELGALFDFSSELLNLVATDILDPFTRESAYAFAAKCDYSPVEADGATATVLFTLTSAMVKTLAAGYKIAAISSSTNQLVMFELTAPAFSGGTAYITASVKQQTSYVSINIGLVTSADGFFELPIDGYSNIIKNTVSLVINALTWTRVDNFDASTPTDKHFIMVYQSAGKARVCFGNGINGMLPPLNSAVYASFATTMGLLGVVSAAEISINVGGDTTIASLTNSADSSGGNDSESVASIVRNARASIRLKNIIWTKEDLETAARASSSSVCKALGIPGLGTATIHVIPTGGGNPSAPLKIIVETYVEARTQFGALPVLVDNPLYSAINITATVTVLSGFTAATVRNLVEFGLTLVACAFDSQIIEYFDDNGVDACRIDVINSVWGWAFTSSENAALTVIINKWKDLLGNRDYREWGQTLEVGDLWIMGSCLTDYGVDVFTLTSPLVNQTVTAQQIIDAGTVTVS